MIPHGASLIQKIRLFLEEYDHGCSDVEQHYIEGQPHSHNPEDCPVCVKAFVNAVREAVAETCKFCGKPIEKVISFNPPSAREAENHACVDYSANDHL